MGAGQFVFEFVFDGLAFVFFKNTARIRPITMNGAKAMATSTIMHKKRTEPMSVTQTLTENELPGMRRVFRIGKIRKSAADFATQPAMVAIGFDPGSVWTIVQSAL